MKRPVEQIALPTKHWWTRSKKARSNCLRVLKGINRIITPAMVNASLPPLSPRLWRKMRNKFPHLYAKREYKGLMLTKKEAEEFAAACKRWKVNKVDALVALVVLFTKIVEQSDKED